MRQQLKTQYIRMNLHKFSHHMSARKNDKYDKIHINNSTDISKVWSLSRIPRCIVKLSLSNSVILHNISSLFFFKIHPLTKMMNHCFYCASSNLNFNENIYIVYYSVLFYFLVSFVLSHFKLGVKVVKEQLYSLYC